MGDAIFGGKKAAIEDLGSVCTGELPRLADGVEDLKRGGFVDGEVADGLVGSRSIGNIWSLGKHAHDGLRISFCKRFALGAVWSACTPTHNK